MSNFSQKGQLDYILNNLHMSKVYQISYEMFSMHYFQLFGNVLTVLSSKDVGILMRRIFFSITYQTEQGRIRLYDDPKVAEVMDIIQVNIQSDENEYIQEQKQLSNGSSQRIDSQIKQFLPSLDIQQRQQQNNKYYFKSEISRAHRNKLDYHNSFSQNYSVDDTLKKRDKVNLSAYAYSGFEIVDYSEPLHKLHKKLLKKIILNR